jgi:hypothetical protein
MDTVKVDVQKLQMLNDRIAQCLEAFGQVRLSVHSLQPSLPVAGAGISHTSLPSAYGNTAWGQSPNFAVNPYTVNPYGFVPQMGFGGLSHTSLPAQYAPLGQFGQQYGSINPMFQVSPTWNTQSWNPQLGFGGISHTTLPSTFNNPLFGFVPNVSNYGFGGISHTPWMGSVLPQVPSQISSVIPQIANNLPWYGQSAVNLPIWNTGISHTNLLNDPFQASRITQTFPYALYPYC